MKRNDVFRSVSASRTPNDATRPLSQEAMAQTKRGKRGI